jgi:hypothetical protein
MEKDTKDSLDTTTPAPDNSGKETKDTPPTPEVPQDKDSTTRPPTPEKGKDTPPPAKDDVPMEKKEVKLTEIEEAEESFFKMYAGVEKGYRVGVFCFRDQGAARTHATRAKGKVEEIFPK